MMPLLGGGKKRSEGGVEGRGSLPEVYDCLGGKMNFQFRGGAPPFNFRLNER